jgi:hypothetical protein
LLWRLSLGVIVTAGCALVLWPVVSLHELRASLARADVGLLAQAFALVVLGQVFRAYRLGLIVQASGVFSSTIYRISALHFFWASLLPAKTGELSLVYMLRGTFGLPVLNGVGVLLGIRFLDFLVIGGVLCIGIWRVFPAAESPLGFIRMLALPGGLLAFLGFAVVPHLSRRLLLVLQGSVRASNHSAGRLLLHLSAAYLTLPRSRLGPIQITTAMIWICVFSACYLMARALDDQVGVTAPLFATAAGSMAFALPVNGFAQLGPFEASWTYAGIMAGMSQEVALASALLVHFVSLAASAVQALIAATLLPAQAS